MKTQVTEGIFKLSPIYASVIYQILKNPQNLQNASPFRKNSNGTLPVGTFQINNEKIEPQHLPRQMFLPIGHTPEECSKSFLFHLEFVLHKLTGLPCLNKVNNLELSLAFEYETSRKCSLSDIIVQWPHSESQFIKTSVDTSP